MFAAMVGVVQLRRIEEHAGLLVPYERVVLEAFPEFADNVDMLGGAAISVGMRKLRVAIEVLRRQVARRGHDIPAGAALRDQVQRGELAGSRIGLFVGGRGRGDKAEMGGEGRKGGEQRHRFEAGDAGIAAFACSTETDSQSVGQEIGIEEPALCRQGETFVKLETGRAVGRLVGMPP